MRDGSALGSRTSVECESAPADLFEQTNDDHGAQQCDEDGHRVVVSPRVGRWGAGGHRQGAGDQADEEWDHVPEGVNPLAGQLSEEGSELPQAPPKAKR